MYQEVERLIIETARELGEDELLVKVDLDSDTRLFGQDGLLDSMGLVTLIVAVEQALEDHFDKPVALADEKALSQANSPYRSVATLAEYATNQIQDS